MIDARKCAGCGSSVATARRELVDERADVNDRDSHATRTIHVELTLTNSHQRLGFETAPGIFLTVCWWAMLTKAVITYCAFPCTL